MPSPIACLPRLRAAVPRALALALLIAAVPAAAHTLKVFATAEGAVISGRVYFHADAPARAARVQAFGPAGELLEQVEADDHGRFSLLATRRVDHRLVADSGDGHRAEVVVAADELPASLPERSDPAALAAATLVGSVAAAPLPPASVPATAGVGIAEVEAMVERAVARQVAPLREQLAAYEDQLRWRDVLGGLGWILGLTGLALLLRPRRR